MDLEEITDKAIDYMLPQLKDLADEADHRISPWELTFIHSLSDQWKRRRKLSKKQKEILGKIWDRV